jgi:hypothetical protein
MGWENRWSIGDQRKVLAAHAQENDIVQAI